MQCLKRVFANKQFLGVIFTELTELQPPFLSPLREEGPGMESAFPEPIRLCGGVDSEAGRGGLWELVAGYHLPDKRNWLTLSIPNPSSRRTERKGAGEG